jgi:hypothetical protein
MKNKNNVNNKSVTELVNKIVELQEKKGNRQYAHSYALGTLQSIINGQLNGWPGWNPDSLQEAVNDAYSSVQSELKALDQGVHALQTA